MNKDSAEADLNTLHEGTVGQLNADFDATVEPYRKLVQQLQAKTTGQVDSVAVESIHHEQPGPNGSPPPQQQPELLGSASRTDTVMVVATSISENAGAEKPKPSAGRFGRCLRRRRQAADLAAGADPMRTRWRVLAFDVLAPVAAVVALVYIGGALAWPLWWVSVCSVLCLLIVEGVVVNFVLARRDGVTVGTDDDGPGLRLAVVGIATVALVAGVIVGYLRWTVPDRTLDNDTTEVVGIASSVSEASATFTPQSPTASVYRATAMMSPKSAEAFKSEFANVAKDLSSKNISAQASTVSAGIEAIGPDAASVAVILRATQSAPGKPNDTAVLCTSGQLSKSDGRWLVDDVSPILSR